MRPMTESYCGGVVFVGDMMWHAAPRDTSRIARALGTVMDAHAHMGFGSRTRMSSSKLV